MLGRFLNAFSELLGSARFPKWLVAARDYHLDLKLATLILHHSQGQMAGVILAGPIEERRGRKAVIMFSAVLFTIGPILMAANFGSLAELLVGRVMSGLESGAGMTFGSIYIPEVAPTEMRGMVTTFYNFNIIAGVADSYWINYGSPEVLSADSSWQWRATLVLQLIPPIMLLFGCPFFPESPRFLMMKARADEAHQSLSRLRGMDETNPYFSRELDELKGRVDANSESQCAFASFKSLLDSYFTDGPTRSLSYSLSLSSPSLSCLAATQSPTTHRPS